MDVIARPEPGNVADTLERSAAVRAATHRVLANRDLLLADYPHWEAWRRQVRAVKTEAVAHLDELLAALEQSVTAWGGHVLWARDAAQARRHILALASKHQVKTVVKAKSMTTEEIGLNPALTAAGLAVQETDLGEFIVQLAGQPPAHLTAPALHLNRRQIAAIFAENLGVEWPPDPEVLARHATAYLNPSFFEAQMGITGVNFAAPDGTLVCLENESNLRFTATLPKVHVALMGLEKIVPKLADVEIMLRLLPASATAQRLTALVHFIKGLKVGPQGKQAFYLILLDNGRRQLARDPEMAEALYCLRCGACLNTCPIFQKGAAHLYGRVYPGAIGILLAPYLLPVGDICDLCTQCGACQEICPVGIRLRDKIHLLRRRSRRFRPWRGVSLVAGAVLRKPRVYRGLEPVLRGLSKWGLRMGWGRSMPPLAEKSYHRQQQADQAETRSAPTDLNSSLPLLSKAESLSPPLKKGDLGGLKSQQLPKIFSEGSIPRAPHKGEDGHGFGQACSSQEPSLPNRSSDSTATMALLEQRLAEARSSLIRVQGPRALAQLLARAAAPLWLEDHPWLRQAAKELARMGIKYSIAQGDWAPEAGTAVTVALGAIPETGTVLVDSGCGVAAMLAYRAQKQIILIPAAQAALSMSQALEFVRERGPGMVSWLTGPSRTADIEKVLVLGAQGPRDLDMILYQEEE